MQRRSFLWNCWNAVLAAIPQRAAPHRWWWRRDEDEPVANNGLLASDNFQRPDSTGLGANWTTDGSATAEENIVSHQAVPPALNATYGQYYTGVAFPNDQIAELTLGSGYNPNAGAFDFVVLTVRGSTSANTAYAAQLISSATQPTLQVAKVIAGTVTNLGSAINITPVAGDVWTFQVAGAALSVYQNYNRVFFTLDTDLTTGLPGFRVFAFNAVGNVAVASWRGYNCVQKDGIWTKQAPILPALPADVGAGGNGTFDGSIVLHEGNAQILSGTVYKMWFTGGQSVTGSSNIYYAESTDGLSWTRKAAAVLANYLTPGIIKNGSTYYMFAQPWASAGLGAFDAFSSPDGITWTKIGTDVLTLGTAGQWDDTFMWTMCPITIIGGTWYATYSAGHAVGGAFSTGLATSPDGLVWTKHVGNPVISGIYSAQAFAKVGATWWLWGSEAQPGQGSAHPLVDPNQTVRFSSPDLITWTRSVNSIHTSQIFAGVNTVHGQSYPFAIIDVAGKATMYTVASLQDDTSPTGYQIAMAIGPASIASIVTQPESGLAPTPTDAFTSGTGNLSSNWTTPTGATKLQIVAGPFCEASATSTDCCQLYTGSAVSADQYSSITIHNLVTNTELCTPIVRGQTGSFSGYYAAIKGGGAFTGCQIFLLSSGTPTAIGPTAQITVLAGDVFTLSAIGNVLSLYQNGFLILQVEDLSNAFPTGFPGIYIKTPTLADVQVSLWAGSNANVTPAYAGGLAAVQHYAPAKSAAHQFGSHIG